MKVKFGDKINKASNTNKRTVVVISIEKSPIQLATNKILFTK